MRGALSRKPTLYEGEAIDRVMSEFVAIRHRFDLEGRRSESTRGSWGGLRTPRVCPVPTAAASPWPALALLCVNLDGLRPINDTYGHDAGAELLGVVAARLADAIGLRATVSHQGGGFACLLAGEHARDQLGRLARKVFDAVSAPLTIGKVALRVRPSIGIARCPTDGTSVEALRECADAAMARAKRHRTGYAFFDRQRDR